MIIGKFIGMIGSLFFWEKSLVGLTRRGSLILLF